MDAATQRGDEREDPEPHHRASRSYAEDVGGTVHLRGDIPVYAGRHLHRGSYPQHTHSFLEVALVLAGRGVHDCVFGRSELLPGHALVIQPGVWHAYTECDDLEVFNCGISLPVLDRELSWAQDDPVLGDLLAHDSDACGQRFLEAQLRPSDLVRCAAALKPIEATRFEGAEPARAELIGHLLLFLAALAHGAGGAWRRASAQELPDLVAQGVDLLRGDLRHPWTLRQLASSLHVTAPHLARRFRAATGQPPLAYLARQRAEAAGRMLVSTDLPVARIGSAVGWDDPNHFARRFKAQFGLAPTAYRERFRRSAGDAPTPPTPPAHG